MADTYTTNFDFKKLTGSTSPLTPGEYDKVINKLDTNLPENLTAGFTGLASGVTQTFLRPCTMEHVRFTLTNVVVTVVNSVGEYGGTQIATWPDENIIIANAEANLSGTKSGDFIAADDIKGSVGIATAASTSLNGATTDAAVVPVMTATADTLAFTMQGTLKGGSATATMNFCLVPDAPNNALFLNFAGSGADLSADGTITVSGTIDIWYWRLGNVTS